MKQQMSPLSQESLEALLQAYDPPDIAIVYFTAKWCGPCNRLNLQQIMNFRPGIQWHLCDVDDNDYSLGYCGGSVIPSWLAIVKGKPRPLYTQSDTASVCHWISTL